MSDTQKQWSPEPWKLGAIGEADFCEPMNMWFIRIIHTGGFFCVLANTKEEAAANAARIVACVSFCAGVPNPEAFLPLDQMLTNSRARCNENVMLEAHLNSFREYVHKLTGNEGEDDALTVLKDHVASLTQQAEANKDARWIPVGERLPNAADKNMNPLIVCVIGRDGKPFVQDGAWFDDGKFWEFDSYNSPEQIFGVTHWRELPPPPISQPSPVEAQEKK